MHSCNPRYGAQSRAQRAPCISETPETCLASSPLLPGVPTPPTSIPLPLALTGVMPAEESSHYREHVASGHHQHQPYHSYLLSVSRLSFPLLERSPHSSLPKNNVFFSFNSVPPSHCYKVPATLKEVSTLLHALLIHPREPLSESCRQA